MENIALLFKSLVKELRMTMGLSQVDFAKELDTDVPSISSWERGKRKPSLRTVKKVLTLAKANGFEVSFQDIDDI